MSKDKNPCYALIITEQRAELNTGGMSAEIDDLNTNIMAIERFAEGNQGTIGEMTLEGGQTLYTIEPSGPSSTVEGSGLRIVEGVYPLKDYSSNAFPDVFELQNVPGRSKILFHVGNTAQNPINTTGCILPGTCFNYYSVENSASALNILRNSINANGGARNTFVVIYNNF